MKPEIMYLIGKDSFNIETLRVLNIEPTNVVTEENGLRIIGAYIGEKGKVISWTGEGGIKEYLRAIYSLGDKSSGGMLREVEKTKDYTPMDTLTVEKLEKIIKDITFSNNK